MLKIRWTIFSLFLFAITGWAQTELPIISAMDYVQIGNTIKLNEQSISADNLKEALKDSEKVVFDIDISNGRSDLLVDMLTLLIECDLPEENYSFNLSYSNPKWEPEEVESIFEPSSSRRRYYARIDADGTPQYFCYSGTLFGQTEQPIDIVPDDQGIVLILQRQCQPADLLNIVKQIGPGQISWIEPYFAPVQIKMTPKLTSIGDTPPIIALSSVTVEEGEEIDLRPYKPKIYDVETGPRSAPIVKPPTVNPLRAVMNQEGLENERVKMVLRPYVFGNEIRLIGSCIFHQELDRTPAAFIDGKTVYRYSATQTVIPICERLSPENNTAQHTITLPNGEKYELEISAAVVDVRGIPIPAYE